MFLGYRHYRLERGRARRPAGARCRTAGSASCASRRAQAARAHRAHRRHARAGARQPDLLIVTKANSISTVHRATLPRLRRRQDLRRAPARSPASTASSACGPRRAYSTQPARDSAAAPQGRQRVIDALRPAAAEPRRQGGGARARDLSARRAVPDVASPELVRIVRGIVNLYERRRVRLFVRRDPFRPLLLLPRLRAARPLQHPGARAHRSASCASSFGGTASNRRCRSRIPRWRACTCWCALPQRQQRGRRRRRASSAESRRRVRTWDDRLRDALIERAASARPSSSPRATRTRFPPAYQEDVDPRRSLEDIGELEALRARSADARDCSLRRRDRAARRASCTCACSARRPDPDLGRAADARELRAARAERASVPIDRRRARRVWIQDFELAAARRGSASTSTRVGPRFKEASSRVWSGRGRRTTASTGCVLARRPRLARRPWCCARTAATCCRPASRSARRTWSACSRAMPRIAQRLVRLFEAQFDPALTRARARAPSGTRCRRDRRARSTAVTSLDEDRILRALSAA